MIDSTPLIPALAIAGSLLLGPAPAQAQGSPCESQEVTGPLFFGIDVALNSFQVLGGAPGSSSMNQDPGRVLAYGRSVDGWVLEQTLEAGDTSTTSGYGSALLATETHLFVGAPFDDESFKDSGSVYVYERQGSAWVMVDKLRAPAPFNGPAIGFGWSLARTDDQLLVGANRTAVYVFDDNGSSWVFSERLAEPPIHDANDKFAHRLAVDGATLLVSDPYDGYPSADPGAVYHYERTMLGWSLMGVLPVTTPGGATGSGLAVQGVWAAVGMPRWGFPEQGRVEMFEWTGAQWESRGILLPDAFVGDRRFGEGLELDGDDLWIGATREPGETPLSTGAVYRFERQGSNWVRADRILGHGSPDTAGFGYSLARSGDALAVGAFGSDGVHLFDLTPGATSYCTSTANSTGAPAIISAGPPCVRAGLDTLQLTAGPVPNQFGLFFFGTTAEQFPVGNGFFCVGGSLKRLAPIAAVAGVLAIDVDLADQPIPPGSTRRFQAWFRDPAAGGAGFDLTDAVAVPFGN